MLMWHPTGLCSGPLAFFLSLALNVIDYSWDVEAKVMYRNTGVVPRVAAASVETVSSISPGR